MAKKQEVLERVEAARTRLAAARKQAKQEAEDERLLAEFEADEEAKARAEHLDSLLSDFREKEAAYGEVRDQALADAVRYHESAKVAAASRQAVDAARGSLRNAIAPQGFGGDPVELERYDVSPPPHALDFLHAGEVSQPFREEHGVEAPALDRLRGIVAAEPFKGRHREPLRTPP